MNKAPVVLLVFLLIGSSLFAQSPDEKDVATAVENLRVAMIDGSRAALENLSADNLSYGHSSGKVENRAEFVEALASGKSDFISIVLSDQTIKITDRTAIVRHTLKADTSNNGTPGTANIHVITVWVKVKTQWKLLARQAVKL
ncbi:nuclear transport factor 2 family protein [soil metagenome]